MDSMTLSRNEAQEIEMLANAEILRRQKADDIIGSQIFSILSREGRILYYPLRDTDICGFVEHTPKCTFVCINTSLPYDEQVFVAAHELYHILYPESPELTFSKNLERTDSAPDSEMVQHNELRANRFAAAFLIQPKLLAREVNALRQNVVLKEAEILRLANLFMVPYKTMVRRLFELEFLTECEMQQYMGIPHQKISILERRLGLLTPNQEKKIVLDNLLEIAMSLFERKMISIHKLEELLRYSDLSLEDMGI